MFLALFTRALFILLMQSVNGAQFLNITFLFVSFGVTAVSLFGIVIVPLTCMYASPWLHKLDFSLEFLNLIIATRKEIVWKWRNFFCLCYVPTLTSAQSFRKGTKSSGSFNNISLNIKFWKKYNLRQPRSCFKIFQGVTEMK